MTSPHTSKVESRPSTAPEPFLDDDSAEVRDRPLGSILAEVRHLSADQIEKILAFQHANSVRFGEAAIALGFVSKDDVLFALAQQFHYPYAQQGKSEFSAELVALNQPFSRQAEAFRAVRSQLMSRLFDLEGQARTALAVLSPERGDGKTFFAANLAVTLAQLGGRTLLVDADLRGPRLHSVFGVPNQSGLSGVLSGRREFRALQVVSGVPGLFLLPAGATPPNPLELLERPAFGLLMRELVNKFEYVIVDTPAYSSGVDCVVAATRCGAGMVVARKDEDRIESLQRLVSVVNGSGRCRLAGVVMNQH